jgi:hypothetical protein
VIGEFRENNFGNWREWQPVLVGDPVRFTPDEGWASRKEAERALIALAETSPDRPSLVAVFAVGDRFVARFVEDEGGNDLRAWHVQMEFRPQTPQWVDTVDGPALFLRVSAQSQSQDWCEPYLRGSWRVAPPTPDGWEPDVDPALLARLRQRSTRFDGDRVQEWVVDEGAASVREGTATYLTDKGQCRVTVTLDGQTESRRYSPDTDDAMSLLLEGTSTHPYLQRLTGDEAQPPM